MKKHLVFISLILSLHIVAQQPAEKSKSRPSGRELAAPATIKLAGAKSQGARQAFPAEDPALAPNVDSVVRIAVLLPFDYPVTSARIYGYMGDKELTKSDIYKLKESSTESMDFYQGLQYAVSHSHSRQKIDITVYDTENSDSVVQLILSHPSLQSCQLIIGPAGAAEARTVAAFCRQHEIFNIQPFVASKSIGSENPYLVRLMPTIDAHLQKEYEMVMDSFADKNIIVYTTKRDRDLSAARQLDTLFRSYNAINSAHLRYTLLNSGDSSLPAAKRSLSAHLLPKEQNIVMMATYDEPLVNSLLRTTKENTVVFGMPTWIEAEQIRADYLSNAQPYFTDNFYADTAAAEVTEFIAGFSGAYSQRPSRYAYMGYDAMSYLSLIFDKHGRNIPDGINKESYEGLGYSFHLSPVIRTSRSGTDMVINYYANTAMHLFQVRDYHVRLVK